MVFLFYPLTASLCTHPPHRLDATERHVVVIHERDDGDADDGVQTVVILCVGIRIASIGVVGV